jgi:hypothetical protein
MGGGTKQLACSPLQGSELVRHTGRQGGLAVVHFLKSKQSLNQNSKPCKFSNTSPFLHFLKYFFLYHLRCNLLQADGQELGVLLCQKAGCSLQKNNVISSVPDPDPLVRGTDPESGSFHHQAKIVRKAFFSTVLCLLYDF